MSKLLDENILEFKCNGLMKGASPKRFFTGTQW
jgi:hypothetical protein